MVGNIFEIKNLQEGDAVDIFGIMKLQELNASGDI